MQPQSLFTSFSTLFNIFSLSSIICTSILLFVLSLQMYAITWQTNLVCRLGDMDVFILLISCICHDLDHPGYNNIYQINAKTELALRYGRLFINLGLACKGRNLLRSLCVKFRSIFFSVFCAIHK